MGQGEMAPAYCVLDMNSQATATARQPSQQFGLPDPFAQSIDTG